MFSGQGLQKVQTNILSGSWVPGAELWSLTRISWWQPWGVIALTLQKLRDVK